MATFKYMVDGKEVTFDSIANGQVKNQFKDLQAALEARLGTIRCPVHNREPIVCLMSRNNEFSGFGSGPCCMEFGDTLAPLMKVPVPEVDLSRWEGVTRIMKYTEMS